MRTLVFVHGRAQEGKDPIQLKWTWIKAWTEGLEKSGLTLPLDPKDVRFPFYGDRLDAIIEAETAGVLTRGPPPEDDEVRFKMSILDEMRMPVGLNDQRVIEASGDTEIDKGPQNWKWVQAILRGFDQFVPGMSSTTVNLFTHDVYVYLRQPGVRDDIDKIVRSEIPSKEECVIVGHSLGSVVTFGILRRDEADLRVKKYVTVGAPLAIRAIQSSFAPLDCPTCISSWFNGRDPRDIVALYPLQKPKFAVSCKIENDNEVDNFTANRHGIVGYLSDKRIAREIFDALVT
jgi:hypothetical protein